MPDMTTRNNEDPADPSVHKQRLTDELDVPDRIIELICAYGNAREDKGAQDVDWMNTNRED